MKRILKISLITILSTLLTLIVLVGVTAGILCYVVFTPEKLTPLVTRVAKPYIRADYDIQRVNLTFLSTFPKAGLEVDGLTIINPMDGVENDTLVHIAHLKAGVDVMAAIDGDIDVEVFRLEEMRGHIYIAADGQANYDILSLPTDTTDTVETEGGWKLRSIRLNEEVKASITQFTLLDVRDSIRAALGTTQLRLRAEDNLSNVRVRALLNNVSATYADVAYLTDATIQLDLPAQVDTIIRIHDASIALNQFEIGVRGEVGPYCIADGSYTMDMNVETNTWNVQQLLAIVPEQIWTMPAGIEADANIELTAHIHGTYDSLQMPLVDAQLALKDAYGRYPELIPYTIDDVRANATAHVDLNDMNATHATIRSAHARINNSTLDAKATVEDILRDMHIRAQMDAHVLIPDFVDYIPENMQVNGLADAAVQADICMSEIEKMVLNQGSVDGELRLANIDFAMNDSLFACSSEANMTISLPKGCSMDRIKADVRLALSDLAVRMTDGDIQATMGQTTLNAYGEYNTKDSTELPLIRADFALNELKAHMDTIDAYMLAPRGKVSLSGSHGDKSEPRLNASLQLDHLDAKMGNLISARTEQTGIRVAARHKAGQDNILLTWNPQLDVDLHQAKASTGMIPYEVIIPDMKFNYSNREFAIDTSRIELGRSDFSLSGKVTNIGPWLEDKGLLEGELRFCSTHADVNQLLELVNGLGNDEAELSAGDEATDTMTVGRLKPIKEANPFIVPKGVDLSIYTMIDTAYAFGETVHKVGGRVYCKDGVMMIEEMGFLCEAAKMKLTGIYKTPRRNHLFAGLDFHLTDIHIAELINMVPQVDSILPMLRSFKGQAEVHLAAETYTNAYYQIKPSTTRGAISIAAKDLTLLDGDTFTKIAKILSFKKKSENKIDSISAEISLYKRQVTVYPFLLHYDRWKLAAGGEHNLSGTFDYNINLLKPVRLGVEVKTKTKKNGESGLSIKPTKCIYAEDFQPVKTTVVETNAMSVRKMIANALRKTQE